ncbi:uncharacterized protein PITG_20318 [Phytophthora infestans T30-4]|uniref:Uncharacterized protein n=1 Tax=Phytophthora infestans (strain T30-4) TaxID=403677 RepID=D0P210_PHYIT|nr:uncharacterized protein PITG_20318 [Phytophthora infestans T30-4]EEY55156.1 conserved hypothetical protein [Phytophthora infestans T30-4]|eukprot:XP_002895655.1 conserved hypothetical protein [Phytophthora infestans T30-4]
MKKCYGKPLGLRTLCETRWNSTQGCFASLLRVQSALQMFHCHRGECVEDRWEQCEQPLFMLWFALHPVYVECSRELPETVVSGIGTLAKIAAYFYRRLFGTDEIGQLRRDMLAWMQRRFTRMKPTRYESALNRSQNCHMRALV